MSLHLPDQPFRNGSTIDGRFEILSHQRRAAWSDRYVARVRNTPKLIVLQVPRLEQRDFLRANHEYMRELQIRAALTHPVFERLIDVHYPRRPLTSPYLILEHVSGVSFPKWIATRNRVDSDEVHDMLRWLAGGLAHAGEQGILLGDSLAEDIVVSDSGVARIVYLDRARRRRRFMKKLFSTLTTRANGRSQGDIQPATRETLVNLGTLLACSVGSNGLPWQASGMPVPAID